MTIHISNELNPESGSIDHCNRLHKVLSQTLNLFWVFYFETANAYLHSKSKSMSFKIKVVFDSCDDHSFITTAACSKVCLKYHEEMLHIERFNVRTDGKKKY